MFFIKFPTLSFLLRNKVNNELSASEEDLPSLKRDILEIDDYTKQQVETDPVSCYGSASHTDYVSTDEHDSLHINVPRSLHLNDSGTDLTETSFSHHNSAAWKKYWAENGERIIWESWIAKYSAYINPEYFHVNSNSGEESAKNETFVSQDSAEGTTSLKVSFDSMSPCQDSAECNSSLGQSVGIPAPIKDYTENKIISEIIEKNRMLVRNLSGSDSYDKLNREGEGWNPLSPVSNDCETTEVERLLSSRCASRTGSTARTVDSMTNVTRLTVSSIDLSESSRNSDSFSSVSSVQSSMTSTSSEEPEEVIDYEQQWNILWAKHYEDEYLLHYNKFLCNGINETVENTVQEVDDTETITDNTEEVFKSSIKEILPVFQSTPSPIRKLENIKQKLRRKEQKQNKSINASCLSSVSHLLNIMKMDEAPADSDPSDYKKTDLPIGSPNINVRESEETEQYNNKVFGELLEMETMGIPLSFGKQSCSNSSSKKRSVEEDSDESTSGTVKTAFNLIGMELSTEAIEPKFKGSVEYKMKHIRSQNRHLKLFKQEKLIQPKHIHFDDDGDIIPNTSTPNNEEVIENVAGNEFLNIIPSSSSKDEIDPDPIEESKSKNSKKKRRKKGIRKRNLPPEIKGNLKLLKYWKQRYRLFSRFDEGIALDEESWFSVTPELIAKNTAERCRCDVIIDAFCGAGGNTIQFAFTCSRVIAIDIDKKKIELAQRNAEIYGVADRIDFIVGDFFNLAKDLKADIVFLSPPWGGPTYLNKKTYNLELLQPAPFSKLISSAKGITDNVCLFLPRNSNTYSLIAAAGPGGNVEIEQNFIDQKLVAITAYYGTLIKDCHKINA